jgi:hypothetical protein
MSALSPEMAAFLRSSQMDLREMARLNARIAGACAAALGEAAIQAPPSVPRSGDETAVPPSRAKRPSEAAAAAPVVKCARRGTAHSSKYIGVSWSKHHCKWYAQLQDVAGRNSQLGHFDVEEDAARAYNAAVIREQLARPLNLEKDGVLLEKPVRLAYLKCA